MNMKTKLSMILFLLPLLMQAQTQTRFAVFTTGGTFGASGNMVRTFTYETATGTQLQVDSALGDFSNAVIADQQYVYSHIGRGSVHPSGGDMIYKYNLLSGIRVDSAQNVPGVQRMALHKNYLITTRGYGANSEYVKIFNRNNLNAGAVYTDTNIPAETNGIAVIRDTLYVSYTHNDTGRLGVISLTGPAPVYVHSLTLDTLQSGIGQLFTYGDFIYALCERVIYPPPTFNPVIVSAGILTYNTASGNSVFNATSRARGGVGLMAGLLYANYSTGPGAFDLAGNSMVVNPALNLDYTGANVDTINGVGYFMTTDYASYGKMYIIDQAGVLTDSFSTDISGGPVDFIYNGLPVANNGTGSTSVNTAYVYNMLLISGDSDGSSASYSVSQAPINGTAVFNNSILTYTPNTNFIGSDTLMYTVTDIWGETATGQFIVYVGAIGTEDLSSELNMNIYPNPSDNIVHIVFAGGESREFVLRDLSGRIVKSQVLNSGEIISIQELPSGVYFLQASGTNTHSRIIRK